jgi:hypothetical protein
MSENNADLSAIHNRLQHLERDSRLWKIIAAIAFVALGSFSMIWYSSEQGALKTERFVLVDQAGKERATLGLDAEGAPSLVFYNNNGRVVALLASKPDGSAAFTLQAADGTTLFRAP